MAEEAKLTSGPHRCPHCGNSGIMRNLHEHSVSEDLDYGDTGYEDWLLAKCLVCDKLSLLHGWYTAHQVESLAEEGLIPEAQVLEVVYPATRRPPAGVPWEIYTALRNAERVKPVNANAYGVLLGRVLELVVEDRGAPAGKLFDRIKHLADQGEIPPALVEVAHGLRQLRNAGAHPRLGELSEDEVELLDELAQAILQYVYTAPALAKRAADVAKKLKAGANEQ